jgi:hypothetical protein
MARQFLPYSTPATPTLFPTNGTLVTRAASNGGVACANGLGMGHADGVLRGDIRAALRTVLQGCLPAVSRFDTRGSYRAVTVLDVGDIAHTPAQYPGIVAGHFTTTTGYLVPGIGTNRARITPALGREVLFNTGAGAGPPPAGAPAAVVVARRARAWQGVGVPAVGFQSNEPDNDQSIGLVVRFDQFSFFSGGDLPSQGEDPIATAVTATGLPDPGGGTYPVPADIPCGKCSHHGAATATSQAYLNTAQPTGAIISCGPTGKHGHPTNTVVNRLHAQATVAWFYLTNDGVNNVNVARTQGADQLLAVGNKSRVAGDNNPTNRNALRDRGDIVLSVTAAQAANAMRQYTVRYWDEDLPGGAGLRPENTNF